MQTLLECSCGYRRPVSSKLRGKSVKCPDCGAAASVLERREPPKPQAPPPAPKKKRLPVEPQYVAGEASRFVIDHGQRLVKNGFWLGAFVVILCLLSVFTRTIYVIPIVIIGALVAAVLVYQMRLVGSLFIVFGELEQNTRDLKKLLQQNLDKHQ